MHRFFLCKNPTLTKVKQSPGSATWKTAQVTCKELGTTGVVTSGEEQRFQVHIRRRRQNRPRLPEVWSLLPFQVSHHLSRSKRLVAPDWMEQFVCRRLKSTSWWTVINACNCTKIFLYASHRNKHAKCSSYFLTAAIYTSATKKPGTVNKLCNQFRTKNLFLETNVLILRMSYLCPRS